MNGMLTNAYMVDKTVANAADRMDDEETQEVPIMAQTTTKKKIPHLLRTKVECSSGSL